MNSIKCRRCGLTNWAHEPHCKRCKSPLSGGLERTQAAQPTGEQENVQGGPQAYQNALYSMPQPEYAIANPGAWVPQAAPLNRKMGLAIASMVLGTVAFVTAILLIGVLFAPIGLILGIVALVKVKRRPAEFGGTGFAVAGVVLSSLVMLWIPIIAAIAIPNLLTARRAANEGSAISSMRKLMVAQSRYAAQQQSFECADLITLNRLEYIDNVLSTGQKSGYRFAIENLPGGGCEMHATPLSPSTGERSFYISTNDGTMHVAKRGGQRASVRDNIVGEN